MMQAITSQHFISASNPNPFYSNLITFRSKKFKHPKHSFFQHSGAMPFHVPNSHTYMHILFLLLTPFHTSIYTIPKSNIPNSTQITFPQFNTQCNIYFEIPVTLLQMLKSPI